MTLSGANLLTDAATFAGSTVSVPVPAAGIAAGLHLLVLKRGIADNPSATKFTLKVFTESTPTAVCPFSADVLGPSNLFTCTTTGSTTPTPDTSSFAAIT